jgi:hypothetical protein
VELFFLLHMPLLHGSDVLQRFLVLHVRLVESLLEVLMVGLMLLHLRHQALHAIVLPLRRTVQLNLFLFGQQTLVLALQFLLERTLMKTHLSQLRTMLLDKRLMMIKAFAQTLLLLLVAL